MTFRVRVALLAAGAVALAAVSAAAIMYVVVQQQLRCPAVPTSSPR